jgi:hypothetical protein
MIFVEQPHWVCLDCGKTYGRRIGGCCTMHLDRCGVCGEEKPVTESRDFGYLVPDWQDRYLAQPQLQASWPKN